MDLLNQINHQSIKSIKSNLIKSTYQIHVKWGAKIANVKPGPYFVPEKKYVSKGHQSHFQPLFSAGKLNKLK